MIPTPGPLQEITRLRDGGYRDPVTRRYVEATTETTLLASVQPLNLTDAETQGGSQLIDRLKVYAPNREVQAAHGDRLTWGSDLLRWGADLLTWAATGGLTDVDGPVLAAAFDEHQADKVRLADGREFVVESSMAWPSHTEAVLLRET